MTAKKRSASSKKELRTEVRETRAKLDRTIARAKRLKGKVARLQQTKAELGAQVKELSKQLKKASRLADRRKPPAAQETLTSTDTQPAALVAANHEPAPTDAPPPSASPDSTWTVVQLRAEARSRGLTGISRKTKEQLLAALE